MIRDKYLRLLFIPILGIMNLFFSGIIIYSQYSIPELIGINLYFILMSYCIWTGASWIHLKIRYKFKNYRTPFAKLFSVSLIGGLFGAVVSGIFSVAWYKISKEQLSWSPVIKCITFSRKNWFEDYFCFSCLVSHIFFLNRLILNSHTLQLTMDYLNLMCEL